MNCGLPHIMRRPTAIDSESGFTLIELMIVVVIVGVLAALAMPRFTAVADAAKEREAELILKQMHTQQVVYEYRNGGFASTYAELQTTGWAAPPLKYFSLPANPTFPFCLASNGLGSYSGRQIDANGAISDC